MNVQITLAGHHLERHVNSFLQMMKKSKKRCLPLDLKATQIANSGDMKVDN
jgi:hypothetical protein